MKNFSGKKIILIFSICILFISVSFICTYLIYKNNRTSKVDKKATNNVSKSSKSESKVSEAEKAEESNTANDNAVKEKASKLGKVIVIDPGHANRANNNTEPNAPGSSVMKIVDGGGACGIGTKTPEYDVNMKVSMKLKALLEEKGYTVIMTKTIDSESPTNAERAQVGNNAHADLEIRIHADSNEDSSINGASMLIPAVINSNTASIHDESKRCGTIIYDTLINEVHMGSRGIVERYDLTGFNWSSVPVVLIEMGFLSNYNEDALLNSDNYQTKLANGLADGISNAVK